MTDTTDTPAPRQVWGVMRNGRTHISYTTNTPRDESLFPISDSLALACVAYCAQCAELYRTEYLQD